MGGKEDKLVLWRKLTRALRKLYNNKDVNKDLSKTNEPDSIVKECKCKNMQNLERLSNVVPVTHEELAKGVVKVLQPSC